MTLRASSHIEFLESRRLLSVGASGWFTDDLYQMASGKTATAEALAKDPNSGTLYAAGWAMDSAGNDHGIVREKAPTDSGWSLLYDYRFAGGSYTQFSSIAIAPDGTLYVGGVGADSNGDHWIVLRATPGSPLVIADNYQLNAKYFAEANGLAIDGAGNVFSTGEAQSASKGGTVITYSWLVREQPAGATGFKTIDVFCPSGTGGSASGNGISIIASGVNAGIYAVGDAVPKGGSYDDWMVRKSVDGGATWSTVDDFNLSGGVRGSIASAITADPSGNLFVVGSCSAINPGLTSSSYHWVVREGANGGASWSTVDNWQIAPKVGSLAHAVGLDANGNVMVVGSGGAEAIVRSNNGPGGSWQTVDDFAGGSYFAFITDNSGASFAGGGAGSDWLMRDPPGAAPSNAAVAASHSMHIRLGYAHGQRGHL